MLVYWDVNSDRKEVVKRFIFLRRVKTEFYTLTMCHSEFSLTQNVSPAFADETNKHKVTSMVVP